MDILYPQFDKMIHLVGEDHDEHKRYPPRKFNTPVCQEFND